MNYLPGGHLNSLEMYDTNGLLDKYTYDYDNQGNRTEIDRFRRDLNDISGKYKYEYDLDNRLTQVSLNGDLLRCYSYDAYGNRSSIVENGVTTKYSYDKLDRLLETENETVKTSYRYDNRGNQTSIIENGSITKTFIFDAANMLAKVTDEERGEATYTYNGFGKRVAVSRPEESIEYLLDLTKDYHNMLERSVNGETERYTYDSNVVSMTKEGIDYYYMLDELGTGMYLTGTDGIAADTYAYDEFGRCFDPYTGKEKQKYTKHENIIQPFAFTGYQHDEMTDSYFAQARYYNAGNGRFVSEDKVRGYKNRPDSINHYLYCYNKPLRCLDLDGRDVLDEDYLEATGNYYPNEAEDVNIDEKEPHPIIIIGGSLTPPTPAYCFGGGQIVIDPALIFSDPLNCVGVQAVGGAGAGANVGGGVSTYVGFLWAEKMSWTEGYGTEVGGCLGIGVTNGVGMWIAGEAGDDNRYGGYVSLGAGAEAEGHVSMSYASDLWYPLQDAYDFTINLADSLFSDPQDEFTSVKAAKKMAGISDSWLGALKEKIDLAKSKIKTEC